MKTYNFFCINCGETFSATRSDARTHSHRCRTDLGRALKMAEMYDPTEADEAEGLIAEVKEKVNRLEAIMQRKKADKALYGGADLEEVDDPPPAATEEDDSETSEDINKDKNDNSKSKPKKQRAGL